MHQGTKYCRSCGAPNLPGVRTCGRCHVDLPLGVVPRTHPRRAQQARATSVSEPVTVLEGADTVRFALAKAMLESAGIPFVAKGEGIQDLFGVGRFPGGVNLVTGPVVLQVGRDNEVEARQILRTLNISSHDPD